MDWDENNDPILDKTNFARNSVGYGLRRELTDTFSIRWAYDEGFRAPTANELFGGFVYRTTNGLAYDPLIDDYVRVNVEGGSNPSLKPEYSDNLAYGLQWRLGFAPGLSIALDYSMIDFQDRIADSAGELSSRPADILATQYQRFWFLHAQHLLSLRRGYV